MNYEITEILPILRKLTDKYTSRESTSVTYETARQLMSAIIYCINETEKGSEGLSDGRESRTVYDKRLNAEEAYRLGIKLVTEKVVRTQNIYSTILQTFNAFGNECYEDTVIKAMPEFFKWYDVRFKPDSNVIGLDYPILISMGERKGIDAINFYLQCVMVEQKFLNKLQRNYVSDVLRLYSHDYRGLIINVPFIVLKKILVNLSLGIPLQKVKLERDDYSIVNRIIDEKNNGLSLVLRKKFELLSDEIYEGDAGIKDYFNASIDDIAAELRNAAKHGSLENVI